jgi:hypothetical protein
METIRTLVTTIVRVLWSWRPRPPSKGLSDIEQTRVLQLQIAELEGANRGLTITNAQKDAELKELAKQAKPGMEIGDGNVLIRVAVVLVWLFMAAGATLTLLVTVFLGRQVPDFTIVERALSLIGVAAAPIIVGAIQKKNGGG